MRSAGLAILMTAVLLTPSEVCAQRGRGGGGGGGGGGWSGGGGGWSGGHGGGYGGGQGGGAYHGGGYGGTGNFRGGAAPSGGRPNSMAGPAHSPGHAYPAHNPGWNHRPTYHSGWYHGDWRGPWVHPYAYRPYGWGWYGGWGLTVGLGVGPAYVGVAAPWSWGYYGYYNPYWTPVPTSVTYINYSQPVVVAPPPAVSSQQVPYAPAITAQRQSDALGLFDAARNSFRQGNYQAALAQTDRAIGYVPSDGVMHEFRALCLFALRDYHQAAAAVHAVTTSGPGWDWTTVNGLYADPNVYAQQLAALENYRTQNPQNAAARFLLAYHYLLTSHTNEAANELTQVVRLEPNDQLAAQLLKALTTPVPTQPGALPVSAAQPLAGPAGSLPAAPSIPLTPARPVDQATLIGQWQATRLDGVKLSLTLTSDKQFTWLVDQKPQPQQLSGTYTLADSYLILSAPGQSALIGNVSLQDDGNLNFKLAGANPADPGLVFARLR